MKGGAVSDCVDFLLPGGCVACGSWVPLAHPRSLVCPACRSRLAEAPWPRCPRCHHPRGTGRAEAADCLHCRPWPAALSTARWACVLRPPASALVHGLKYDGWRDLALFMGGRMARAAAGLMRSRERPVLIVPVPTTASRLRARGYNQAGLLARAVGATLDLPVSEPLRRPFESASQTTLAPDARRANVRGAFAAGPSERLRGASVLLVDDVLTTGATAAEAAVALVAAGAARVSVLTFARALPDAQGGQGGRAGAAA